ncbi:MAG: hypothetical protein FWE44_01585 [Defluviitaleaceae bacterium]|nr:hypothetical protein [Defluviitaleaceae bacterium]
MKRFFAVMLTAGLGLLLVACGGNGNDENNGYDNEPDYNGDYSFVDGNDNGEWNPGDWVDPRGNPDPELAALMDRLYEGVEVPMVETWELTSDNFYNVLFIDYIEGSRGVMSQAMINVIPHAVVLLEVPEGMDVEYIAAQIEANADPARWICVNAEKMDVFVNGQFIVMAMATEAEVDGIGANVPYLFD